MSSRKRFEPISEPIRRFSWNVMSAMCKSTRWPIGTMPTNTAVPPRLSMSTDDFTVAAVPRHSNA